MQLQRRDDGAVNLLLDNYANIIMPIDKGADEYQSQNVHHSEN
jgi:hypothetical protein